MVGSHSLGELNGTRIREIEESGGPEKIIEELDDNWNELTKLWTRLSHEKLHCAGEDISACEWAPSAFVRPIIEHFESRIFEDRLRCEQALGEGTFDNDSLTERLINPERVGLDTFPDRISGLRSKWADLDLSTNGPTMNHLMLDEFMADLQNYMKFVVEVFQRRSSETVGATFEEHSAGADFASVSFLSKSQSEMTNPDDLYVDPTNAQNLCAGGADTDGEIALTSSSKLISLKTLSTGRHKSVRS